MTQVERTNDEILQAIGQEPLLQELPREKQEMLAELIELVAAGQLRLNLTAIRDPLAMVRYHLADSLALLPAMREFAGRHHAEQAVDIGTGGGFPLLPMAVARPDVKWTGVESVQKKAAFVEVAARNLGLENVEMLAQRAEDVAHSPLRGQVDMVTARAVGAVASLLEVGVPLLKSGGRIYLFKTAVARQEWQTAESVLEQLGAQALGEFTYKLEEDKQTRVIFIAEKIKDTPQELPRRTGVPFKKPLV